MSKKLSRARKAERSGSSVSMTDEYWLLETWNISSYAWRVKVVKLALSPQRLNLDIQRGKRNNGAATQVLLFASERPDVSSVDDKTVYFK